LAFDIDFLLQLSLPADLSIRTYAGLGLALPFDRYYSPAVPAIRATAFANALPTAKCPRP
jgi:hypothetical protein